MLDRFRLVSVLALLTFLSAATAFGQLTYNLQITHPTGNPGGLTTADFDRDGRPDVAYIHGTTLSVILQNEGPEGFSAPIDTPLTANSLPVQALAADVNNDGIPDMIVAEQNPNQIVILLGNGNGTFRQVTTFSLVNSPREIQVGDLNKDGKVDIVVREVSSNQSTVDLAIYLGTGGGFFSPGTVISAPGSTGFAQELAVDDFNRDGKLDLALAGQNSTTHAVYFKLYFGYGNGTFKSPVSFSVPYSIPANYAASPPSLVSADFNGGAMPDIGVETGVICGGSACGQAHMNIFLNNGSGSFTFKQQFQTSGDSAANDWVAADLNNNLTTDLMRFETGPWTASVQTYLNSGSGFFSSVSNPYSGGAQYAEVRDLNLDGRHDVAIDNWDFGDSDILLAFNTNGTPNCAPPSSAKLQTKICTPGTSVSSTTFTVRASGNSPIGIKRLELWVDGVKRYQIMDDQLRHSLTLSAGTHRITVVAVDKYLGYASTVRYVSVP